MKHLDYGNILLVHPLGYQKDAADRDVSRMANIMPPLGLASIAAYIEREGIDCTIIDCYAYPESDFLIRRYLLEKKPAFIGLSCTTSGFLDGIKIAKMAKEITPDIVVIVGGPHVSALKEKILEDFAVIDYCIIGEGEITLTELIKSKGQDVASIQGIIYRDIQKDICSSGYRANIPNLDTLPFPAYDKLKGYPKVYQLPIFNYPRTPNSNCISSRGCPYACTYCDRSVFERSYRYNSSDYVYEHLIYLKNHFGIRHINFYDDQFTFNRERIETILEALIEKPLSMTFNCAVRAEHIDADLIHKMKEAGCWMISLGIENGDEKILALHKRNTDLIMLAEKIRLINQAGIRTKGLFMLGLPGETEFSIKKSIDYFLSLPIDDLNITKFTPFPGTPIYQNVHELGEFKEDWEKMDCMHFLFIPKGMTKKLLDEYFTKFYKAHFMRIKVLWDYFTMLWRSPHSWLRFIKNMRGFIVFARSDKRLGDLE